MQYPSLLILISFLISINVNGQNAKSAVELINAAQVKAAKTNKKVMVKYTATWCGYCHKMDTAMADKSVAKYFNKNYVVVRIHIKENKKNKKFENAGGDSLFIVHGGSDYTGIPYWVVLDTNSKAIANSKKKAKGLPLDADGENVGCPIKYEEITYFISVLQATGNFNTTAIEKIKKVFLGIKL